MFRIEHNAETGEIKEIELSAKEIKELEKEYADSKKVADEIQLEVDAKNAQRQSLLDRLGITADEAKLLLG
jgi:hypothetical protein